MRSYSQPWPRSLKPCVAGLVLIAFGTGCSSSVGSAPDDDPSRLQVREGFTVEQVAGPDLVAYPMFGLVDPQGRLFLFESTGHVYEETADALTDPQFRINVLEDLDGDGVYDRSTIFADSVGFPQGGVFYDGSLYASSAPDLLKLTDTDGDGVADARDVVLSGWTLNVNANSLIGPFMGPDGWFYLTSAIEGFDVTTQEGERLRGETSRIWRVRPDGSDLEWISAGGMNNPVELTFTEAGEPIGTETYFTDPRAGQRDALVYWTEGGVYPKPNANIARDRLPLTGGLMPVVSKYSRVAPSGITRYRGTALGDDFTGNLFSAQFNTHRVLRHVTYRDGASFRTEDEVFFWTNRTDFHPTDVLEDGDGNLLVVETGGWFIKGCPLSQVSKPELKGGIYRIRKTDAPGVEDPFGKTLDLATRAPEAVAPYLEDARPFVQDQAVQRLVDAGEEAVGALTQVLRASESAAARTRAVFALYRIGTPEALAGVRTGLEDESAPVRVAAARAAGLAADPRSLDRLMDLVQHDEPAPRRQAATALGQLGDPRAIPALLDAAASVEDRFVEHAIIYALITLQRPEALVPALNHAAPGVQKTALIALDQMDGAPLKPEHLVPFLGHANPDLHQTGLWVAAHHPEWSEDVLAFLEPRLQGSVGTAPEEQAVQELLVSFCKDAAVQRRVAHLLGDAATPVERRQRLLDAMAQCSIEAWPDAWIRQVGTLLSASDPTLRARAVELIRLRELTAFGDRLDALFRDRSNPVDLRLSALGAQLMSEPDLSPESFETLYALLTTDQPAPLRQQAARVLGQARLSDEQQLLLAQQYLPKADAFVVPLLLDAFDGSPDSEVGHALIDALTASPALDSFTEETLTNLFASYPDEVRAAMAPLLDRLRSVRAQRLARLEALDAEMRTVKGDIERGRALYFGKATCSTCHTVGSEGGSLGPDLTSIGNDRSRHDVLEALVFPSASFVRAYETYQVRTPGTTYLGIITQQTPEALVLATGPGVTVHISRNDIASIEPAPTSLMPQGLEQLLTAQERSDLMAFLLGQDQRPDEDEAFLR